MDKGSNHTIMSDNYNELNTGMYSKIQSSNGNHTAIVSDDGHLWVGNTDISGTVSNNKNAISSAQEAISNASTQINNVNKSLDDLGKTIESKSSLKIKEGTNTITFSVVGNDVIVWIGANRMGAITFK